MTRAIQSSRAKPTIDQLMTAYLADPETPGGRENGLGPDQSLQLLRNALDGYGVDHLRTVDIAPWREAYEAGDEGALCRIAGTIVLLRYLPEFADWFLVRKVAMSEDDIAAVVEDVRDFIAWLRRRGEISQGAAKRAIADLDQAADDLPAAERLSEILYDLAARAAGGRGPAAFEEVVDDYLVIERVAPGRLWFVDVDGPLKVPEAATALARPGWTVNLALGRRGTTWEVLEVGNVYPETLA